MGVGLDGVHGLGDVGFDDPALDPPLEVSVQVVAREPAATVGHGELGLRCAGTHHGLGRQRRRLGRRGREALAQTRLDPVVPDPAHPGGHRCQPVLGDASGVVGAAQPRLDEPVEVGAVSLAPVGLGLGAHRTLPVDAAQRVGHDRPTEGRGATSRTLQRDHDTGGIAHGPQRGTPAGEIFARAARMPGRILAAMLS
ncbi:hypothetical protein [Mobilicoccus caccae]|uniref:Uncharacterized protein n=1 Tax=Mobilicoccus caccae TaxID=1859295 RepID=A0ABQ6IV76_9MICO|nr:hypothetical protein [Mobilicoccus caccae]GMA41188.1 hypothetical protein GCM10025883_32330 [Mobilicoccus caccae]